VLWENVEVGERASVRGSILGDGVRLAAGERVETEIVLRAPALRVPIPREAA
jgi:hypothetical protein